MKKEYLNEEEYQKSEKKLKTIALIIMIGGVLIGGILILFGIIGTKNGISGIVEEENRQISSMDNMVLKNQLQQLEEELQTDYIVIKSKITEKSDEISKKTNELNHSNSDTFSAKMEEINKLKEEVKYLKKQVSEIEAYIKNKDCSIVNSQIKEICDLRELVNDTNEDDTGIAGFFKFTSVFLIPIGIGIASTSVFFAAILFFVAGRRKIQAFSTQQTMPVTQETIEKMTPTIGNAAKSIASSIKEGLKDEKSDE